MKLVVSCIPKSESRIARDLLDAIFNIDPEARVLKTGYLGLLLLETSANVEELVKTLNKYPIRGLKRVFLVVSSRRMSCSPLAALLELVSEARRLGLSISDVKLRGRWKDLSRSLSLHVGRCEGVARARIETLGDDALLTVEVWPKAWGGRDKGQ